MSGEGPGRTFAEVVEAVYLTHGCSCEEHPTNGAVASCNAWRRRMAERVAGVLLPPEQGGMAFGRCPHCGSLIKAEQAMCWSCAEASVRASSQP